MGRTSSPFYTERPARPTRVSSCCVAFATFQEPPESVTYPAVRSRLCDANATFVTNTNMHLYNGRQVRMNAHSVLRSRSPRCGDAMPGVNLFGVSCESEGNEATHLQFWVCYSSESKAGDLRLITVSATTFRHDRDIIYHRINICNDHVRSTDSNGYPVHISMSRVSSSGSRENGNTF